MKTLSLNWENCFGIKKIVQDFSFEKSNIQLLYAPNGSMKSSFAKTMKCMELGNKDKPEDRIHPEYVQYFAYQFCEWCRDAMIDSTSNARAKEFLAGMWKKILSPRVYPPWECPFNSPMPRWPRGRR